MGNGRTWTQEETDLLRENMSLPDKVLAEKMGRSLPAIQAAKVRLRHGRPKRIRGEHDRDTRPSGWYEETVGVPLIEYEPAFSAWKHYHRYVEVVYEGEIRESITSWVTLKCRRDADAPLYRVAVLPGRQAFSRAAETRGLQGHGNAS